MEPPSEVLCRFLSADHQCHAALRCLVVEVAIDIGLAAAATGAIVSVETGEDGVEVNGWKLSFIADKALKENSLSSGLMKGVASFVMCRDAVLPLLLLLAVAKRGKSEAPGNKVTIADSDGNTLEPAIKPGLPILTRMGVEFEEIRSIAEHLGLYQPGVNDLLRRGVADGSGDGFWF